MRAGDGFSCGEKSLDALWNERAVRNIVGLYTFTRLRGIVFAVDVDDKGGFTYAVIKLYSVYKVFFRKCVFADNAAGFADAEKGS